MGPQETALKTRTHFAHRIDMLDAAGEIQEHLAGVEDYILAEAVWREAITRWPRETIILRQGARVVAEQPPPTAGEMNEGPPMRAGAAPHASAAKCTVGAGAIWFLPLFSLATKRRALGYS